MMVMVTRGVGLAFHSTISMARLSSSGIPTTETKAVALEQPHQMPRERRQHHADRKRQDDEAHGLDHAEPEGTGRLHMPPAHGFDPGRKYSIMKASALRKSPHTPAAKGVLWISRNGSA